METIRREPENRLISSIMRDNKVSLNLIAACMEKNKEEINAMDQIFDLDDEMSIRKRLVLLFLISRDQADANLKFHLREENITADHIKSDIEKYKAIIIAALIENTVFFASACNWCSIIQGMLYREQQKPHDSYKIKEVSAKGTIWIVFKLIKPLPKISAGGEDRKFTLFEKKHLAYKDINGTLYIMTNNNHEAKFEFAYDEFQDIIPYCLELRFITRRDRKEYRFNIPADSKHREKNREKNITKIKTNIMGGMDFSEGILEGLEIIFKPADN